MNGGKQYRLALLAGFVLIDRGKVLSPPGWWGGGKRGV